MYVSEPYNERVQIFDSNGNYVYSFGSWNVPSSVLVARDFAYVMGLAAHNNQLFCEHWQSWQQQDCCFQHDFALN